MAALHGVKKRTVAFRQDAWHWQTLMGLHRTGFSRSVARTRSLSYANWILKVWKARARTLHVRARRWMAARIVKYQTDIAFMSRVMGLRAGSKRQLAGVGSLEARFDQLRQAHQAVQQRWQHPPHESQLLCIHRGEGSWNDRRNPKYNGGLQMDKYFEAAYGAIFVIKYGGYIAVDSTGHKYAVGGHSYLWTPVEQMWAAEKAIRSQGFGPWPQTAVNCGLA